MAFGFLRIVLFAHFANPFINAVFASPPKISLEAVKDEVHPRRQRTCLWPEAAVIYEIHADIGCPTTEKCKIIMDAIQQYEKNTCIRLKDRSGETNYVEILDAPDRAKCTSLTGRVGGSQRLVLGTSCWYRAAIMHELGHTVGLPDEISRPDRDEFVDINFDNMSPDSWYSYRKIHPAFPEVLTIPFDYYSIMMYGAHASAMDPTIPTLKPKKANETIMTFQDKDGLSYYDERKISALYKCQGNEQNPKFPFDVQCSFAKDMCGFKNLDGGEWSQRKKGSWLTLNMGKYLGIDFKKDNPAPARLASINFHGLSPLDEVRGPNGCVSFSYFISSDKLASLQLSVMQLRSPQQQLKYAKRSTPLWAKSEEKVDWTTVSIPVQVTKPFALVFQAEFKKGAAQGAIGFDDFKLSYSRCTDPLDAPSSSQTPRSSFQSREEKWARIK